MSTADAERVLENWAVGWSSQDVERLLSLYTDDCVFEDVTLGMVSRGKEQLQASAKGFATVLPDLEMNLTSRFVAGNWGCVEWVMSGTHQGDLPGLPATGKRFSVRGATVFELEGEKIRRNSDYWDATSFARQVGLLPPA